MASVNGHSLRLLNDPFLLLAVRHRMKGISKDDIWAVNTTGDNPQFSVPRGALAGGRNCSPADRLRLPWGFSNPHDPSGACSQTAQLPIVLELQVLSQPPP
uniref:Uncharacterized protein n=1 Tax=Mus spicilegus TaxID=10103 RepID=A0A8C6IIJ9_MUSSI